jgi:hypothetical protein
MAFALLCDFARNKETSTLKAATFRRSSRFSAYS